MRSHNRPVGHCLLCMSILFLYLSGNQTEKTREPGRGTAMISGFPRKEVELGVPLHGRNLVRVFFGLPGWCATSPPGSALDKTPMEISCAISKTQLEEESLLNSTPVLSTKLGVCPLQHVRRCQHLMATCNFFLYFLSDQLNISAVVSRSHKQ